MNKPRGIRNNNPGNIRKTDIKWKGEVSGTDNDFEAFVSMPYGYRALIKLLQNYQKNHRLKTIRQLINRWAPPSENKTAAYISTVSKRTGIDPDITIDMKDRNTALRIAAAVSYVENGLVADMAEVVKGWELL